MNAFNTVVKFFQDSGMFIYPSILIMALASLSRSNVSSS